MVGDAENLPLDEDTVDLYTIAFGIRNVIHIDKVYMTQLSLDS